MHNLKVFMIVLTLLGSSATLASDQKKELVFIGAGAEEFSDGFRIKLNFTSNSAQEDDDTERSLGNFDPIEIRRFINVSLGGTKVNVDFVANRGQGINILGKFSPQEEYKVTVAEGLKTHNGLILKNGFERVVKIPNYKTRFRFTEKSRYVPAKFQGSIPWEVINADGIEFKIRQIPTQNLHHWNSEKNEWYAVADKFSDVVSERVEQVDPTLNSKKKGVLSLENLKPLGQGVFEIHGTAILRGVPVGEATDLATVIVTDLTIISKISSTNKVVVWVKKTSDLSPVRSADVTAFSRSNKVLGTCTTGLLDGSCEITWVSNRSERVDHLIARTGNDVTYGRVSETELSNDKVHAGNRDYFESNSQFQTFIYSSRNLYRPGETLEFAAVVRDRFYKALGKLPIKWVLTNPKGQVLKSVVTETSEQGMGYLHFNTDVAADTGPYQLVTMAGETEIGKTSVLVEEFVPERLAVRLTSKKDFINVKERANFDIDAQYLFGGPVSEGKFTVSCSLSRAFDRVPGNPDFWTGTYVKGVTKPTIISVGEGTLSSAGTGKTSCDLTQSVGSGIDSIYNLSARVDVRESGSGRTTSTTASTFVGPTNEIFGLKLDRTSDNTIHLTGAAFDLKGQPRNQSGTVDVELILVRQNWYYTRSFGGESWDVEEVVTPVGVKQSLQWKQGKFNAVLEAPDEWGQWVVRATDRDTNYRSELMVGYLGASWLAEGPSSKQKAPDPSQLKIVTSKDVVAPNQTLDLAITAPFKGKMLISTETNEVHNSKWVTVEKPGLIKTKVNIPKVLPNVYITALLLKDPSEDNGKKFIPARAWGAKSVRVSSDEQDLTVKISAPEIVESRKELNLTIENKEGVPTEYAVAVIDEGILQMTKFKTPSPTDFIFEPRKLGVSSMETLGWTMAYGGQNEKPGGDEESRGPQSLTMPTKLISFWFPSIQTNAKGKAILNVPLPAFQGKVRVMVVGSSKSRFGSADKMVTVRDPIVLQATLPRFLIKGDSFVFPVSLRNLSGKEQEIKLQIENSKEVSLKKTSNTIKLKNEEEAVVKLKGNVLESTGSVKIAILATTKDGTYKSEESFDIPVKSPGVEQSIHITKKLTPSLHLKNIVPVSWRLEDLKVEASVSDLPFLSSLASLDSLLDHPYGCLEQTTSGTMPLLVMGELLPWISPEKSAGKDVRSLVESGIHRVISMQNGEGGFSYWPGGRNSDYWASAYATNMLMEAKKRGFEVPDQILDQALNYLQKKVRGDGTRVLASLSENDEASASPFAIYVLAKGGKTVSGELRQFATEVKTHHQKVARYQELMVKSGKCVVDQAQTNPGESSQTSCGQMSKTGILSENYFLLVSTAKMTGDKETLGLLSDQSVFTMPMIGMRESTATYWSPLRSEGLRLSILEDLYPGHEAGQMLAERISRNIEGNVGFYSTQDIGWSVLGLGKWLSHFKRADQSHLKKVKLSIKNQPVKKNIGSDGLPIFEWGGKDLIEAEINATDVVEETSGWLHLKAKAVMQKPPKSDGVLDIKRNYLDSEGQSIDLKNIKVGDLVVVHLRIANQGHEALKNVAIIDRLPAGFEIENPRIRQGSSVYTWMGETFNPDYQSLRDDRVQAFGSLKGNTAEDLYYIVRAVTEGSFRAPASFVEAMYQPEHFSYGENHNISIKGDKVSK